MGKYFGTDGIRGKASLFDSIFVSKIVNSVIDIVIEKKDRDDILFLVGGDTRESTDKMIQSILCICNKRNIKCLNLGVFPTPGISYISKYLNADISFDITASHNPSSDNGIKIFNHTGEKLSDELELRIEEKIDHNNDEVIEEIILASNQYMEAYALYLKHLTDYIDGDLSGLRIGIDCANGAMSVIAKEVFQKLKAEVIVINDDKSYGHKINDHCGSTHIDAIKELVVKEKLDFGCSFDGDGDRCLFVDCNGNLLDGDHIIAITSKYLKDNNKLNNNGVIITIMANPGLYDYLNNNSIDYKIADVGDINVKEDMKKYNYSVGGEQCGHIILPDHTSGDGLLTALFVAQILKKTNQNLGNYFSLIDQYPQVAKNIDADIADKSNLNNKKVKELLDKYTLILKEKTNGIMNVRASGTQELIRVTIWGKDFDKINIIMNDLVNELVLLFNELKENK